MRLGSKSQKIIGKIREANVSVVVLFSSEDQAQSFLAVALMAKLKMVWVASSGWSLSSTIRQMPGIENIGTIIGFTAKSQPIAGLEGYVRNVLGLLAVQAKRPSTDQSASTCNDNAEADYERQAFQNSCRECSNLTPANASIIHDPLTQRMVYGVYTAVYSVAHALYKMLLCNRTHCKLNTYPHAWQLLKELKTINFTMRNSTFYYDEFGNMNIGYDILTWTVDKNAMPFRTVGEYTGNLTLDADQIQWHTKSQKPESTCLKKCDEGSMAIAKGSQSCCFDCIACPKGTYANYTVFPGTCLPCPESQWSEPGSTFCRPATYLALTWTNNFVITLMVVKAFLVLIVVFVTLLFLARRQTPLLQACGASLSILALAGLATMCCSVFLFVAYPSDLICQLQQPLFASALSICLSSFLVKSLRIVACTAFPQKLGSCTHWLITQGGGLLVLLLLLVQVLFCTMFVRASPLLSQKLATMSITTLTISLSCSIDRIIEFSIMFGYNALLVLISLMCSFLSPKPVHQYNLARDITFAMLIFLSAWIVFIPCYASVTGQDKALIQAAIILFSCLGVLVAAFLPKCYILLFKPELNTPEFFATYLLRGLGQKDLGSERQVTQ
ncbi:taste receptor type 1 member 3-like [Lissotriton helveticus]